MKKNKPNFSLYILGVAIICPVVGIGLIVLGVPVAAVTVIVFFGIISAGLIIGKKLK